MKISSARPRSRPRLLSLIGPGDIFGAIELSDSTVHTRGAVALTPVQLGSLSRAVLFDAISESPLLSMHPLKVMSADVKRKNRRAAQWMSIDVPGRVAQQLLDLVQRFGSVNGASIRVRHDLRQQELADLIGSSRESVHKSLRAFADRDWIRVEGREITVLDPARLVDRAKLQA